MLGSNDALAIYDVHVLTKISKLKVFLAKRNITTLRSRESADGSSRIPVSVSRVRVYIPSPRVAVTCYDHAETAGQFTSDT